MSRVRLEKLAEIHALELSIVSLSTELLEVQNNADEEKRFEERMQQLMQKKNEKLQEIAGIRERLEREEIRNESIVAEVQPRHEP
jgi:hypothetical protein